MSKLAIFGGKPVTSVKEHQLWPRVTEDERSAVNRVLDAGVLSGNDAPEAKAFEEEFAEFVQAKYALMSHSGTSALTLALAAAGVQAGDEVIVPAYSFIATPLSLMQLGAIPRFVDIDPKTGNIDPSLIPDALRAKTKAIMPVHIHGCPADMDELIAIAEKHDLIVVEDAAQAHGATYKGKCVGAVHHGGGFSLQSSKNLGAGEGGIYVTNDAEAIDRANQVRNFGLNVGSRASGKFNPERPLDGDKELRSYRVGSMYRGNEMTAAFARAQLKRLGAATAACQQNAARLSQRLAKLPGVQPPHVPDNRTSVFHKYRVMLDTKAAGVDMSSVDFRNAVIRALNAEGAGTVMWQDVPLPAHPLFRDPAHTFLRRPEEGIGELVESYRPEHFPCTQNMLDSSVVLFTQSYPLIAQNEKTVDAYGEAFEKVWEHRGELAEIAKRS